MITMITTKNTEHFKASQLLHQ